jgi:hypothetical protein
MGSVSGRDADQWASGQASRVEIKGAWARNSRLGEKQGETGLKGSATRVEGAEQSAGCGRKCMKLRVFEAARSPAMIRPEGPAS